jgi:nucleoside-diphosphate-sugar epimerase
MTAFVTGGSGFVGRELIAALARLGKVKALARSARSEASVRAAGAEPVSGDLDSIAAMQAGMAGCELVYHCAAHTEEWDTDAAFHRVNVLGTDNLLAAAKAAGVKRVVLISSEAVLADGSKLHNVDETAPYPSAPLRGYPASKGECERRVLAANGKDLQTVVLRPRYIWGRGDTANMIKIAKALEDGRFAWVDQGRYLTSTCHVANVCEGAVLAGTKGKPGEIYFITDGKPVEFRWLLTEVFKSQGLTPPTKNFPHWVASAAAGFAEGVWRLLGLKSAPFATKVAVGLMGQEVTINDAKARRELGYEGKMSVEAGLAELSKLPPVKPA